MSQPIFIGLDIGTTSIKAGVFDRSGQVLGSYASAYETQRLGNGWVEQDPEIWMQHVFAALERFADTLDLTGLASIGITSQVNTHVFVGADGQALAPAIVWQDGRCAAQAAELDAQIAEAERMAWWGAPMPIDASHCAARMKWMAETQPELWAKTDWVMLPKDYCILKLTGQAFSDPISNIGMVNMDLDYVEGLLELVPGANGKLPKICKATDLAGRVRDGMPCAGTPVGVGTMDAWAGICGVGINQPGDAFYLSGTSEVLGVVSEDIHPTPGILVFPKVGDLRIHVGPTQSGGASVLWFCGLFGIDPAEMAGWVEQSEPCEDTPLFLPHLQGERAPIWDINARGTLLGMTANTDRGQMARAVYEGVGFSARLLAESLQASSGGAIAAFKCGGGGYRSDIWNQIRADILGVPLMRAAVSDPGVLGAAALGAVAAGVFGDLNQALDQIVSYDRTYSPNPAMTDSYARLFQLYQDAYAGAKDVNHALANF